MPTVMTHAVVGLALGRVFTARPMPRRFWLVVALLPVLPDLDVIAFALGIPYEGRRGAFWALLGPDVELRCTGYDVGAAVERIRATGYPDAEQLAGWLLDPEDPAEVSAYFEGLRS